MGRQEPPEGAPRSKALRVSWFSALLVWVVISVSGWLVIGGLITVLTPEQSSQTADEKPAEDLRNLAPASGPGATSKE